MVIKLRGRLSQANYKILIIQQEHFNLDKLKVPNHKNRTSGPANISEILTSLNDENNNNNYEEGKRNKIVKHWECKLKV